MKNSTKINVIAGLWGIAAGSGVFYVNTLIQERAKRKAIDKWKEEKIFEIKRVRENRDYSPLEILVDPVSEILAEELKNWDIKLAPKSEEA